MTLEEMEKEHEMGEMGFKAARRCEPCSPTLALEPELVRGGSHLYLIQNEDGRAEYMFLTDDGRLVAAEDY